MNARTFTLADVNDRLFVDMTAPLPLGYRQAIRRAINLRAQGPQFSYTVIAVVMAEYHGFKRAPVWWRRELRAGGVSARHLGASYGLERASA